MDSPDKVKSELQLLREENIKKRDAFWASITSDPEYAEVMRELHSFNNKSNGQDKKHRARNSTSNKDYSYRSFASLPLELRKSARLQNKSPIFTENDLIDEPPFKRRRYDDSYSVLTVDLERIVYAPRKFRETSRRSDIPRKILLAEDVTDEMIENIARKVSVKIYHDSGTSCHQCRQKTTDQKTCCRNVECVGVRGQFCGVCLENRYGEDAAVALKDPLWHCPVCRNICNCSFCRAKVGKRPTGILTPLAHQTGHKSVKDFLESLKGEGDYASQDNSWQKFKDPNNLLGFSNDIAQMGGNIQHNLKDCITLKQINDIILHKEKDLELLRDYYLDSYDLLGFFNENVATTSNGDIEFTMKCSSSSLKNVNSFVKKMENNISVMFECIMNLRIEKILL